MGYGWGRHPNAQAAHDCDSDGVNGGVLPAAGGVQHDCVCQEWLWGVEKMFEPFFPKSMFEQPFVLKAIHK